MRYKCLILDHDDTVVRSTETVHYPAFLNTMATLRPALKMPLDEFWRYNFEPGFHGLCSEVLELSEKELQFEHEDWLKYVEERIPPAFDGVKELIAGCKSRGGVVCVSSHSMGKFIMRDYAANALPAPDAVFGWDMEPERRKPAAFAVEEAMRRYSLKRDEILVIDDMLPGLRMADAAGVSFACASWAVDLPERDEYMLARGIPVLRTVKEFESLLFEQ